MPAPVRVYGANWCEDTIATREQLDRLKIPYEYIDVDRDKDAEDWIKRKNNGKRNTPTVDIRGQILIEPDAAELTTALRDKHLLT
jgi:glutaredoxin